METKCFECELTVDQAPLRKCPMCHRYFCEDHSVKMSGRPFCSKGCAQTFFFDDAEE